MCNTWSCGSWYEREIEMKERLGKVRGGKLKQGCLAALFHQVSLSPPRLHLPRILPRIELRLHKTPPLLHILGGTVLPVHGCGSNFT